MHMFFKKITKIQIAKTMIYITEFDVNSEYNFSRSGESVLMAGQRLDAGPHLKAPDRNRVLFFKWATFSIPVPILNITLHADILHITQSNNF